MSLAINHFYRFGEFTVDSDQKVLLRNGETFAPNSKGIRHASDPGYKQRPDCRKGRVDASTLAGYFC